MRNGDRPRGFAYLAILIAVAIMGAGLALAGEVWHTSASREKEAELLFAGNQYRRAIERYYRAGTATYPRTLRDLLKDPRKPTPERYLRRLYPDPMTGKDEWGIVKSPDGGVMGVYSLSTGKPLKAANFRARDRGFENAGKYSDWKFVYTAPPPPAGTPGAKPVAPGTGATGASGPAVLTAPGSALPVPPLTVQPPAARRAEP